MIDNSFDLYYNIDNILIYIYISPVMPRLSKQEQEDYLFLFNCFLLFIIFSQDFSLFITSWYTDSVYLREINIKCSLLKIFIVVSGFELETKQVGFNANLLPNLKRKYFLDSFLKDCLTTVFQKYIYIYKMVQLYIPNIRQYIPKLICYFLENIWYYFLIR